MPVTMPDDMPIVAIVVVVLVQVPPPPSVKAVACPTHTLGLPLMAAGSGFTFIK
jgi:hypothetical protein